MKKTAFFTAEDTGELQLKVNAWLAEYKDISILNSGMTEGEGNRSYSFFILYEAMAGGPSVAVAEQMADIIPEADSLSETTDVQLQ